VSYKSIVFALAGAVSLSACAAGKSISERQAEDAARSLAEDTETCAKVRAGRATLSDEDCMRLALSYRQIAAQPGPVMLESPSRAFTNDLGACGGQMTSTPGLMERDVLRRCSPIVALPGQNSSGGSLPKLTRDARSLGPGQHCRRFINPPQPVSVRQGL
jgi:hypothetical protein